MNTSVDNMNNKFSGAALGISILIFFSLMGLSHASNTTTPAWFTSSLSISYYPWSSYGNTTMGLTSSSKFVINNLVKKIDYNVSIMLNYPSNTGVTTPIYQNFSFNSYSAHNKTIYLSVSPVSSNNLAYKINGASNSLTASGTPGNIYGLWNVTVTVTQNTSPSNTVTATGPSVRVFPLGTTLPLNFSKTFGIHTYNGLMQASASSPTATFVVGESNLPAISDNVIVQGGDDNAFVGYWTWQAPNATDINSTNVRVLPTVGCINSSSNGIPAYTNLTVTNVTANTMMLSVIGSCTSTTSTNYTTSTGINSTYGTWHITSHEFEATNGKLTWPYDEQDTAFTGVYNGYYYINASIRNSTTTNMTLTVLPHIQAPVITESTNSLPTASNIIFTATVSGGESPYTYNFMIYDNATNTLVASSGPTSSTYTYSPPSTGSYYTNVTVTDNLGFSNSSAKVNFTVFNGISFGTPQINIPNSTLAVGQNEIITANVSGGVLPYNSFEWFLNGNVLTTTNTPSITFNGNTSTLGTDALQVIVTDNALNTATGSGTVTVTNGLSFGTPQINIPNSVLTIGQNEIITANVLGGVLPYNSFAWFLNGNALTTTNTPSITFNGNYSTLGTDNVMVTVTDNAGNTASGSGTVDVINGLIFGQPQIDIPSSILMVGQNEIITANVSGGILPYNSFAWTLNGNALTTTNTPSITFNGNASTLGIDNIEVTVTDNALKTALGAATVKVVNATSITLTPATKSVTSGDSVTYNVTITGGVGPFNIELYNVTGSKQQGSNVTIATPGGSNTITFTTNPTGTFTYNAIATDQATNLMFTSTNAVLTVNARPSTGGGGGGGGGGGSSGGIPGGGGSMVPTVNNTGNCTTISNFTQHNQESFTLNKQAFTVVENYINPTSAGVTVNGKSYLLDPNVPQTVLNTSSGKFNITLTNISYLPIIDTIKVEVCYYQNNQTKQSSGSGNPMVVSLTTNKTISVQNGPVLLTGSITNGTTGPYTYNFTVTNSTGTIVFTNVSTTNKTSNSTVFTPTLPGIYTAAVHITTGGTLVNSNPKSLTVSALQQTTTTVAPTTTITAAPPASVNNWWIYLIILLIIVVLLLMYYYMRRRKKASKGK